MVESQENLVQNPVWETIRGVGYQTMGGQPLTKQCLYLLLSLQLQYFSVERVVFFFFFTIAFV